MNSPAAAALVEFVKDGFAGKTPAIGLAAHDAVNLGGDDHGLAAGVAFEETPEPPFAGTTGVNVGGVKEVDATFEGLAQERLTLFFAEAPRMAPCLEFPRGGRAIGHAAEADARY